jgi:hypothetical protein
MTAVHGFVVSPQHHHHINKHGPSKAVFSAAHHLTHHKSKCLIASE